MRLNLKGNLFCCIVFNLVLAFVRPLYCHERDTTTWKAFVSFVVTAILCVFLGVKLLNYSESFIEVVIAI